MQVRDVKALEKLLIALYLMQISVSSAIFFKNPLRHEQHALFYSYR